MMSGMIFRIRELTASLPVVPDDFIFLMIFSVSVTVISGRWNLFSTSGIRNERNLIGSRSVSLKVSLILSILSLKKVLLISHIFFTEV